MKSDKVLWKETKIFLAVGLGMLVAVFAVDYVKPSEMGITAFYSLLKTSPSSTELDKAIAIYEKETGKDKSTMTFADIDTYVTKVRSDLGGGWTRESLDAAMSSIRKSSK